MCRQTQTLTLLLIIAVAGLTFGTAASAAPNTFADVNSTGAPLAADNAVVAPGSHKASVSATAPNFAELRRQCRKVYRTRRAKRACIRQVNRYQRSWQRQHSKPQMTLPKAMSMAKLWAANRYKHVGFDQYSPSGYDWGDCALRPDNTARCSWIIWEPWFNQYDPSGEWSFQCLGRAVVWYRQGTLWVENEDGTVSCGLNDQRIPSDARPIRDYPLWL